MKYLTFILLFLLIISCENSLETEPSDIDYREEMRQFVIAISEYAKQRHPDFVIIPQNGIELVTINGESNDHHHRDYLQAIDGNGQEDLFYGYEEDNEATPQSDNSYLREFLDISKSAGNVILVTDYCSSTAKIDDSYQQNHTHGYVPFAAMTRELNEIPTYPTPIFRENNDTISSLESVQNFLYLINPEKFSTKSDFINAITNTNYDLLIMDLFFTDNEVFSANDILALKQKANGGARLVIGYMSIGEAENYRYYWHSDWNRDKPDWLDRENPSWPGNYKVKYWREDWQKIIFGSDQSYLDRICAAGFDGAYLDIIDAFEYFE